MLRGGQVDVLEIRAVLRCLYRDGRHL